MFESDKDLLMYYQSTLRNVGVSLTVSYAALTYSRFYRAKNYIYSTGMVLASLLLLLISVLTNLSLYNNLTEYILTNKDKENFLEKELLSVKIFMTIQFISVGFALFTLYRISTNRSYR